MTVLQTNYVQSMHAYNDRTCKTCLHVHELVLACQMHNCIYSVHTIGEMLMIACMQCVFNVVAQDKQRSWYTVHSEKLAVAFSFEMGRFP